MLKSQHLVVEEMKRAKSYRQRGDFAKAIALYQNILTWQPKKADIYGELANTYSQQQEFARAIAAYQRAITLKPQAAWVYQGLAKAFARQQQHPEAIAAWRKAITLNNQSPDWVYYSLGHSLYSAGDVDGAIAAYQRAIELNPQPPNWLFNKLINILIDQEKPEQAIALYHKAIKANSPFTSVVYVKIGDLFSRQDQFFAAKAAYRQADLARSTANVREIITFIRQNFDFEPLQIDILDNGCDPSGQQLALLAEQTTGRVVGTNIYRGFPDQTIKVCRPNNEFYHMDGQDLNFADNSFDLVISLNVLEHIRDPVKYLRECYRVLRPGGFGFFSWYPLWSGATGHHVHPDMVSRKAQELGVNFSKYSLDGTSIPHWGHLLFDSEQMLTFLTEERQYHPALAEWMTKYIYYGRDLNRWFWSDFWRTFQSLDWTIVEHKPRGHAALQLQACQQLVQKYGEIEDFKICGAKIIVQK